VRKAIEELPIPDAVKEKGLKGTVAITFVPAGEARDVRTVIHFDRIGAAVITPVPIGQARSEPLIPALLLRLIATVIGSRRLCRVVLSRQLGHRRLRPAEHAPRLQGDRVCA
jgi:hypothetical protein